MSQNEFQAQQIVEAFQIIGKAFGQLVVLVLRIGMAYVEGRHPAAITAVQPPGLDRNSAITYLQTNRTTFANLRKTEDFGEYEDCGKVKFSRDKLDAYIARRRIGD